jgi:hypothetical protein
MKTRHRPGSTEKEALEFRRYMVSTFHLRGLILREIASQMEKLYHRDDPSNPYYHKKGLIDWRTGKAWNKNTISRDIKLLVERYKADALRNIYERKAELRAEIREVRKTGWQNKDMKIVLQGIRQESDLYGLDSAIGTIDRPLVVENMTPEQIQRRLEELEAKRQEVEDS